MYIYVSIVSLIIYSINCILCTINQICPFSFQCFARSDSVRLFKLRNGRYVSNIYGLVEYDTIETKYIYKWNVALIDVSRLEERFQKIVALYINVANINFSAKWFFSFESLLHLPDCLINVFARKMLISILELFKGHYSSKSISFLITAEFFKLPLRYLLTFSLSCA